VQATSWPRRVARFVRSLFSSGPPGDEPDDVEGGLGVREPRRPHRPTMSGGVALEVPPEERADVEALGEKRD
jgi:hypothetical protein